MTSAGIPGDPRRMEITYLGIPRNPRRLEIDWDLKRMPDILKIAQGPRELEILAKGLGSQAVPQDCESPGSREPRRVKIVWDKKGSQKHCKKHPEPMRDKQTLPKLAEGGNKHLQKNPKSCLESAEKRPQKPPKQPPRSLQNPLDPVARKRKPVLSVLTRPPEAQTLRFPRFFHFRSTLRDPPFWGLLK